MSKIKPRYNEIVFSDEQEKQIVALYKSGKSTTFIGKVFCVSHKKIARVLESHGIKRIGNGRRKYPLNEHYFDSIDTANKAYILGFLYADGNNNLQKQTISMSLQESDKAILERMRKEINSEKPLEFIDYSNKHDFGYNYKNQYRLLMFSKHMCETLDTIGMTPSKSLTLTFPDIPQNLYSHFIRGYFDGDGSFFKKGSQSIVTITSTEKFCSSLKKIIEKSIEVNFHIYEASNKNGVTKVLITTGNLQTKAFLDYIYKDADMYLERKYKKYLDSYYNSDNETYAA